MEQQQPLLDRLRLALQALAQPAEGQEALFPELAPVAKELALNLHNAIAELTRSSSSLLSPEKRSRLERLDGIFSRAGASTEFWTPEALRQDPRWEQARFLAREALASFDWTLPG